MIYVPIVIAVCVLFYLPSDPGVCFVDGTRGKLLSTHRNAES